jgi:bis(5'-nucleosyl)-tetraphosphatase (symmetrical)
MALYLIGDIQGCDRALQRLLDTIGYSPSRDTLYVLGDLVNRGPASDAVLRRMMNYGDSAVCLLGNHDLNLLAVAQGLRKCGGNDTLGNVLAAPDRNLMLDWLRHQHMALLLHRTGNPLLLVHAGVLPAWSPERTLELAQEVEWMLRGDNYADLLKAMYGSSPAQWSDTLTGMERLRVIVNALTRLRFCTALGVMEFETKEGAAGAPLGYMPWFEAPNRQTSSATVAFGHWSTLGWTGRQDVLSIDTGCVWGGCLSAVRFSLTDDTLELIQVRCDAAQTPGH